MFVYVSMFMSPMLVQRNRFYFKYKTEKQNNNNQPCSTSSRRLQQTSALVLLEDSQIGQITPGNIYTHNVHLYLSCIMYILYYVSVPK